MKKMTLLAIAVMVSLTLCPGCAGKTDDHRFINITKDLDTDFLLSNALAKEMDPENLVAAYQAGEWDGTLLTARGPGFHAIISSPVGELIYFYDDQFESAPDYPGLYDDGVYGDTGYTQCGTRLIPDLPDGKAPDDCTGLGRNAAEGVYVLTRSGTTLYKAGETIQTWPAATGDWTDRIIPGNSEPIIYPRTYAHIYRCVDKQLIRLFNNGSTAVIVEDVIDHSWNWCPQENLFVLTLTDGVLSIGLVMDDEYRHVQIAEDVVDANLMCQDDANQRITINFSDQTSGLIVTPYLDIVNGKEAVVARFGMTDSSTNDNTGAE